MATVHFPGKWRKYGVHEVIIMRRKRGNSILERRHVAAAADPLEVKGLAIAYRITPAQVRGLLVKYGRDWLKFDKAAMQLRTQ